MTPEQRLEEQRGEEIADLAMRFYCAGMVVGGLIGVLVGWWIAVGTLA